MLALCVSIVDLVSCAPTTLLSSDAVIATKTIWNSSVNKTATDIFTISNFDIAGLLTIKNLEVNVTRVFKGDDLVVDVEICAVDLAFGVKIDILLGILGGVLESEGIDLEAMIVASNNLTASFSANFDLDTRVISSLEFNTVGLGAVLGDLVPLEEGELTIHKDEITISKDDAIAELLIPFAIGHVSTLFGPAVGVNAGESGVAADQILTSILPVLESLFYLIPVGISYADIFDDINTILDSTITQLNLTYSSTVEEDFINSQTYSSCVIFNIDDVQLSMLWEDVLKDAVGDKLGVFGAFVSTIINILDSDVALFTIETFIVTSTYDIL